MPELNTDALKALHKKRRALDKLIAFTRQISRLGKTFEMASEIAKPSQRPNPKLFPILNQLMDRIKHIKSAKLVISLDKIDKDIRQELAEILELSEIDETDFFERLSQYDSQDLKTAYDLLMQDIQDFKRKTQTDVAIRYELNQRGVPIRSGTLPIDQERLNSKACVLKARENQCKRKIIYNIEVLLNDTQAILDNEDYPDELKEKVNFVNKELQDNLHALQTEQDFENIPVFVAAYDIFDTPDGADLEPLPEPPEEDDDDKSETDDTSNTEATESDGESPTMNRPEFIPSTPSKLNPFRMLVLWLKSPWQVSWQAIKQQQTTTHDSTHSSSHHSSSDNPPSSDQP